eukprot:15453660-Alexandrium_andersonii.AAC.1
MATRGLPRAACPIARQAREAGGRWWGAKPRPLCSWPRAPRQCGRLCCPGRPRPHGRRGRPLGPQPARCPRASCRPTR